MTTQATSGQDEIVSPDIYDKAHESFNQYCGEDFGDISYRVSQRMYLHAFNEGVKYERSKMNFTEFEKDFDVNMAKTRIFDCPENLQTPEEREYFWRASCFKQAADEAYMSMIKKLDCAKILKD